MTDPDELYGLLPAVYRLRDADAGYPLRTVLRVVADQVAALEGNIAGLYDDLFVETCQDWLVPYFGDLAGVALGSPLRLTATDARSRVEATSRRRQVANAITDRRRKGTLAVLERLAGDVTGWPARTVEFGALVAGTQTLGHPDPTRTCLVDTRDGDRLQALGTAFDMTPFLADVRRISSRRHRGAGNLHSVGVAVWRLVSEGVERAPAECVNDENHYTFDALGDDTQLCTNPIRRTDGAPPAGDLDVPTPITRLALERRLEDYYGHDRSLCVYRGVQPVNRREIVVADLTDWRYRSHPGQVCVDPVLGRIAFPARHAPEDRVLVRYFRLTVGGMGGGHYPRTMTASVGAVYRVGGREEGHLPTLSAALREWDVAKSAGQAGAKAVIEITDDGVYEENLRIALGPNERLEIRAAEGCRPILRPVDQQHNRPEALRISGPEPEPATSSTRRRKSSRKRPGVAADREAGVKETAPGDPDGAVGTAPDFAIDGVWVAGHPVELTGRLGAVTIRHCTLVPRWLPRAQGTAGRDREPSLVVRATCRSVEIESSVVGRIRFETPEVGLDPPPLIVADSILDAVHLDEMAVEGADDRAGFVRLTMQRVTVLGGLHVHTTDAIQDSILTGRLVSLRRQVGAIGFSYLPPDSLTPRRTSCQPDEVLAAVDEAIARGALPAGERERQKAIARARVAPRFDSVRFGEPAYARLADKCAPELVRGAMDEGELGAFHDLWLGRRTADLRARLEEFAPAGADIAVLLAT